MSQNRNSTKARRTCFDTHKKQDAQGIHMVCHWCKQRIDPVRDEWRADHTRRHAEGGEESAENLWPIHTSCDVKHKAPQDTREVAKGKRYRDKHYGIRQSKNPMPGSKRSGWKRKMDGTVVKR